MQRIYFASLILFALLPASYVSAERPTEMARFETHVRPVLATTCIKCHGPKKQEGELRLDSFAAMVKGGESGPAIVPGKPEESLLLSALRYEDLEMPPSGQLANQQVRQFALWIGDGALWPEESKAIRDESGGITAVDREWWAFQPLKQVSPPSESFSGRSRNEIDRFVHRRLAENNLYPADEADRVTLARRLYQNVIGLPPTPEQVAAFLEDDSDHAYEALVDLLLADKRYGEHWARFWLDLVRYAESDGWKADSYRPHIWRYRDYVVKAFNDDKPYPEFVREQLAGDELPHATPDSLAATGYLRLGIYEYNQRNSRQHWDDMLNEITDVTGDVFLGMGMACARCHDHKFDPLLQVDYYKLRAFFEPIVFNDEIRYATAEQIAAHEQANRAWLDATKEVRERMDSLLKPYYDQKWKATVDKFPLEIQASFAKPMEARNSWDQQMAYFIGRQFYEEGGGPLNSMKAGDKVAHESLTRELAAFDSLKPDPLPTLMSATNFQGELAGTTIPGRTEAQPIEPGFIRVLAGICGPEFPDCGRNRRTALADWITEPGNPLTTRVIVNRIWKQHFGRGIVQSVSDFGTLGGQPTHPELLDWLTTAFIADGWSLKRLHKRILLSATWRQSATHDWSAEFETVDPQNTLLWRRDVKRLSAEQIRDAMLMASGELAHDLGGPSVMGPAPRRSLYVKSFRNTPDRFLHAFDAANGLKSVGQRSSTTTPVQALMMINGDYTLGHARKMAARLGQLAGDEQRVRSAIQWTWGRQPTAQELDSSLEFVASQSTEDELAKLIDFCHVLLNSNEFLYVD